MTEPKQQCPKCSKPLTPKRHGSITQWMSVCNCQLLDETAIDKTPISLCTTCGKRINTGRAGSFTQWVFRSDNCTCRSPLPAESDDLVKERLIAGADGDIHGTNSGIHGAPSLHDQDIRERMQREELEALKIAEELDLNADTFPLDRYTPIRAIGFGASGNVYLCRDRLLRTMVAVKCLRNVSGAQLIAFQQEARALSKLNHPGIVKVLNFGASDSGAPYMVMEYIEGISLEKCIQEQGPLPVEETLEIVDLICNALAYVHAKGIFHRDLKSSNIIRLTDPNSEGGEVRIIDFGVAMVKHASQEPTIVQGRTVVGTPQYMAPDQALGKPYDERSEIYALGCTLFELLTGDVSFAADTPLEIISKHASEPPPRLSEISQDREFPEGLEKIVEKCLAKDPGDRFLSIKELQAALAIANSPDQEESEDADGKNQIVGGTVPDSSQKKTLLVASVMLLILVGGLALASWWIATQNNSAGLSVREEINPLKPMEDQRNSKASIQAVKKMIANQATDYRLGESLTGEKWHDQDLKIFEKCRSVNIIDFSGSPITEEGLKYLKDNPVDRLQLNRTKVSHLEFLPNKNYLTLLELTGTAISDESLKQLVSCSVLETLDISETNVTLNGVKQLKPLPRLLRLAAKDCPNLSAGDLVELEKVFPNCQINFNDSLSSRYLDKAAKFARRKNFVVALARLNDGLAVARSGSDARRAIEVHILATMAAYNAQSGKFLEAEKLSRQAVEIGKANGCTRQLANAWYQLAVAESNLKKEKQAIEHVNECIALCDANGLRDNNLLRAMKLRVRLLERTGRRDQAQAEGRKMRKFARSLEAKDTLTPEWLLE